MAQLSSTRLWVILRKEFAVVRNNPYAGMVSHEIHKISRTFQSFGRCSVQSHNPNVPLVANHPEQTFRC